MEHSHSLVKALALTVIVVSITALPSAQAQCSESDACSAKFSLNGGVVLVRASMDSPIAGDSTILQQGQQGSLIVTARPGTTGASYDVYLEVSRGPAVRWTTPTAQYLVVTQGNASAEKVLDFEIPPDAPLGRAVLRLEMSSGGERANATWVIEVVPRDLPATIASTNKNTVSLGNLVAPACLGLGALVTARKRPTAAN